MTTLTKLLPPEAAPAQPILDRAHVLALTLAERAEWPQEVKVDGDVITFGVTERRPLEVNDVFVDEKGEFWAVRPAVEKVLHVTGDLDLMREAAGALINRGVRVAEAEGGFAVVAQENVAKMLTMIGLEITEVEEGFDPIRVVYRSAGGCGCGDGAPSAGNVHAGGAGVIHRPGADELVIHSIPRVVRHAVLFAAVDNLPVGENIQICAPHQPEPLFAHLQNSEQHYRVETLEAGPIDWRYRVTRLA